MNNPEAATVRLVFQRFLAACGLFALEKWLNEEGVRSKLWVSTGGRPWVRFNSAAGPLRHLLQNRLYVGEIAYEGAIDQGRDHLAEPFAGKPRSNWANDNKTLSASRPIDVVVLSACVMLTNETPGFSHASTIPAKSRSNRDRRSTV